MNPLQESKAPTRNALLSGVWIAGLVFVASLPALSADVVGYSLIKGHFLYQTGPDELEDDPLFGYSVLGGVDLADLDLLDSASIRLPEGETLDLEDYGDSWSLLESFETQADLDEAYQWGDYIVSFDSKTEGEHSCLLEIPETALPPIPRLVNFGDVQSIDPFRPLTLTWAYDGPLDKDDFVQLYVTLGHGEVFSTPNLGEEGALTVDDRTVTIPAETFEPGYIHSLNLEVTRLTSINGDCYPEVQGFAAVFRSTTVDLFVRQPPWLRLLARTGNGLPEVEVVGEPEASVVLQGSVDFQTWVNLGTNSSPSGTNVFQLQAGSGAARFFRVFQE
ncbi:MAG: hypothetical protein AB7O66_08555 [Limisphaerales bacterium]